MSVHRQTVLSLRLCWDPALLFSQLGCVLHDGCWSCDSCCCLIILMWWMALIKSYERWDSHCLPLPFSLLSLSLSISSTDRHRGRGWILYTLISSFSSTVWCEAWVVGGWGGVANYESSFKLLLCLWTWQEHNHVCKTMAVQHEIVDMFMMYFFVCFFFFFYCDHFSVTNTKREPWLLTVTDGLLFTQLREKAGW